MAQAAQKELASCRWTAPAPAILNAIENATGVSFNQIPLMPEMLMEMVACSQCASHKKAQKAQMNNLGKVNGKICFCALCAFCG